MRQRLWRVWAGMMALGWLAACVSAPQAAQPTATVPLASQAVAPSPVAPSPTAAPPTTPAPTGMSCVMVAQPATPHDASAYLLPQDHVRGSPEAPVVLVVYADFQCPGCAVLARVLVRLQQEFGPQVAVVYRHFPLAADNDKALLAVQAAEAAAQQGAFWALHDALYTRQGEWADLSPDAFRAWLRTTAEELGLDADRLLREMDDPARIAQAQAAWEQGRDAGLAAVPVVFVNGRPYTGPPDYAGLRAVVALALLAQRQFAACPPWVIEPGRLYRLTLQTDRGPVVMALDSSEAPQAVNSLVFLAQQGWFEAMPVYRVEPGQAVYWGDPSGTGYGHAGYFFALELQSTMRYDAAGWVGLVNEGPDTNSSRFFITLGPRPAWDGRFTRVGRVVQGLDILQALPAWDGLQPTLAGPSLVAQWAQVQALLP